MTIRRLALWLALPTTMLPVHAALADRLGQAPDDGPSIWRVAGALLLCILFALAGALVLRARGGLGPLGWPRTATGRRLKLVESVRLTPQVQLCIVTCDDREMLFATSPSGATFVRDVEPAGHPGADA